MPPFDLTVLQRLAWLRQRRHCQLCDEATDHPTHSICTACESELPWLGAQCQICAVPLPAHGMICGACQSKPPSFSRVEAPWRYAFPVDNLITRFKHQAQWPHGRLLAELLAEHLSHAYDEGLPRPQALLPVPLARKRQRRRGFNQAQMLAALANMPQGTFASEVVVEGDKVNVTREIDGGLQTVALTLPAIVTTDLRLNEPRYAKLPDIMKAKKKPLESKAPADYGVEVASRVSLVKVETPAERKGGVKVASVDELIEKLKNEAKVL